ncbi:MAG: helix-turn-helix domain-containing protein, partial [Acidobacteriota bacterium]
MRSAWIFAETALQAEIPDPIGYPREPASVGEHIKKMRLDRGLLQREVARLVGVCTHTIRNWEAGASQPTIRHYPDVIRFLGYDPNGEPRNLAETLLSIRREKGWSLDEFAKVLDVWPDTISGWEQQAHRPKGGPRRRLLAFLEKEGV